MDAGKHVSLQKPMTTSLADADRMVEACATRGIPFAAGLVVSSHPDYNKAYRLAAEGAIGQVLRINLYDSNGQVDVDRVTLTGQSSPGAKLTLLRDVSSEAIAMGVAGDDGSFTLTSVALRTGANRLRLVATDLAGGTNAFVTTIASGR